MLRESKFVATITGTAGWEAISGGKNALVFGKAWYRRLPGVFEFSKLKTIDEILNYKIDHEQLQQNVNELLSKTGNSTISMYYLPLAGDINYSENNSKLYDFLRWALPDMKKR